jgi:hypothetical protein
LLQLLDLPADKVLGGGRAARGLSPAGREGELTEYRFNTRKNQHFFCHCGVRAFGVGNDTPIGRMYGVNVGCLEGVSEEEFSRVPIPYVDGRNDRMSAPEFFGHL